MLSWGGQGTLWVILSGPANVLQALPSFTSVVISIRYPVMAESSSHTYEATANNFAHVVHCRAPLQDLAG